MEDDSKPYEKPHLNVREGMIKRLLGISQQP